MTYFTQEQLDHERENLYLCAINEGDMYPQWLAMAKTGVNTPDSDWAATMRTYAYRLAREGRALARLPVVSVVNPAAMRVRDYYLQHVKEM